MKKYIILLFLIIPFSAIAQIQKGDFTVNISTPNRDLNWSLTNEGDFNRWNYNFIGGATTTVGTQLFTTLVNSPVGFTTSFKGITITTDGPGKLNIVVQRTAGGLPAYQRIELEPIYIFGASGGTVYLPDYFVYETGFISFTFLAGSTTAPNVSISPGNSTMVWNDPNFSAKYQCAIIGNSISYDLLGIIGGSGAANLGATNFVRRLVSSWRTDGIDVRAVNKGVSGINTAQTLLRVNNGDLDYVIKNTDIFILELGTNDAAISDATTRSYSANIQAIIDAIIVKHGTKIKPSFILIGVGGSSVSNVVTNSPGYRTALAAIPALGKYTTYDMKYFDPTVQVPNPVASNDANFFETTFGTQLHWRGDTQQASQAAALYTLSKTMSFWLNAQRTL